MEKPPIRILQRPCPISSRKPAEPLRPPPNFRTLEQREADYAAARRRIMGSDSPDFDGSDVPSHKGNPKGTTSGNGQNGNLSSRQSSASLTGTAISATPLMSIQASPVPAGVLTPELGLPARTASGGIQSRPSHNGRQSLAVVNVNQKLQQQSMSNGARPMIQTQQQQQQRLLTSSSSSPSLFPQSSRTTQPIPLFPSQVGAANAGLLPTPPGFNYSIQNASLNTTLHQPQSAALALMQQLSLFQQYQTLNGFQTHLVPPGVSHTPTSLNHLNFPSINPQTTANQKYAHPPAFS
jgi:hypothetical protein